MFVTTSNPIPTRKKDHLSWTSLPLNLMPLSRAPPIPSSTDRLCLHTLRMTAKWVVAFSRKTKTKDQEAAWGRISGLWIRKMINTQGFNKSSIGITIEWVGWLRRRKSSTSILSSTNLSHLSPESRSLNKVIFQASQNQVTPRLKRVPGFLKTKANLKENCHRLR